MDINWDHEHWHEVNSDPRMADAILDRLVRKARGSLSISSKSVARATEHDGTTMGYSEGDGR